MQERWGAPEVGKGAWVFVAAIGDLNRHYYDLLLASMQCLQATNSKYEMVLLYEGQITQEVQVAFRALNVSKVCHGGADDMMVVVRACTVCVTFMDVLCTRIQYMCIHI